MRLLKRIASKPTDTKPRHHQGEMDESSSRVRLPLEIWLEIIDAICSAAFPPRAPLPARHSVTQRLLALSRTCKMLYEPASRALYTHCCYIDRNWRIPALIHSLHKHDAAHQPKRRVERLFIDFKSTGAGKKDITGVSQILENVAPDLRTLILDWRYQLTDADWAKGKYVENWSDFLPEAIRLRTAFTKLKSLEVFCSPLQDWVPEADFSACCLPILSMPPGLWLYWRSIRTLVLNNTYVDSEFVSGIATLRELNLLILAMPNCLSVVDIKEEWAKYAGAWRPLTVAIIDTRPSQGLILRKRDWTNCDVVSVLWSAVPMGFYDDVDPFTASIEWVTSQFMLGNFTEWSGVEVLADFD